MTIDQDHEACELANKLTQQAKPYREAAWAIESAAHELRQASQSRLRYDTVFSRARETSARDSLTRAIEAGKALFPGEFAPIMNACGNHGVPAGHWSEEN